MMGVEKRTRNQIILGSLVWMALYFTPIENGILHPIAALLLFALFVIFSLGLSLTKTGSSPPIPFKVALFLQPFAAFIVATSFFLPKGVISGTFAIAWLPLTLFAAWNGAQTLFQRGVRTAFAHLPETSMSVAQLYLPIGAVWLLASRLGIQPLGFNEPIILLTAIHFHFAGFAAPILAGLVGREIYNAPRSKSLNTVYQIAATIVLLGPALVAIGITFSPLVEAIAGALLAMGYTGLALITLGYVFRQVHGILPRVFLGISSVSAVVTMFAAAGFALRIFNLFPFLSIPQMVAVHGWGNAIGFVFCGLLGWGLNQKSTLRQVDF
jgi:hypothetical protein